MITVDGILSLHDLRRYRYLQINPAMIGKSTDVIKIVPKVFDLVRMTYLFKGKLLFVEDTANPDKLYINSVFLREAILYSLASLFKCSVYDIWLLINNQVRSSHQTLFFTVPQESIKKLSAAIYYSQKVITNCMEFINFQCYCGCNTLVAYSESPTKRKILCKCSTKAQTNGPSECPSDGCSEYLDFLSKRFRLNWKEMRWSTFKPSDFILGPLYAGKITNKFYVRHLLCSEGPVENSMMYVKKNEKSSFYLTKEDYTLFCCKVCHMWVYGIEANENKIIVPINNMITKSRKNGLLQFKVGAKESIKAPVLRNINLEQIYN